MLTCSSTNPNGSGTRHYGNYVTWAKLMAASGVKVLMPEFRNALVPGLFGSEIAPFPGGLNDCISAVRFVNANAVKLGIDPNREIKSPSNLVSRPLELKGYYAPL